MPRPKTQPDRCANGCESPPHALGLCVRCYQTKRRREAGTQPRGEREPMAVLSMRVPVAVREAARSDPPGAREALEWWAKRRGER